MDTRTQKLEELDQEIEARETTLAELKAKRNALSGEQQKAPTYARDRIFAAQLRTMRSLDEAIALCDSISARQRRLEEMPSMLPRKR